MRKIRYLQSYLVFALPFVLLTMLWSHFQSEPTILQSGSGFTRVMWEIFSWNLMLWFVLLFVFLLSLIFYPAARESTLKRLANIKERDERESLITGRAARKTYLSTLSLLIFLFFISTLNVDIKRVPEAQAVNGKTGVVNI